MKVKAFLASLGLILILSLFTSCDMVSKLETQGTVKWAGLRYSPYGIRRDEATSERNLAIPTNDEFQKYISTLTGAFEESTGTFVLIPATVSEDEDDKGNTIFYCSCNFVKPDGVSAAEVKGKYINFRKKSDGEDTRYNYEDFLTMCDNKGYSVWLQAEPGDNDLSLIAKILLSKYGSHKCVKGYGIDLEWWYPIPDENTNTGTRLDDATAQAVVETVRSFNKDYTVFAKHWEYAYMPPKYRDGMIFVNDSQQFSNRSEMVSAFTSWAKHFQGSPVLFQIGYGKDYKIWKDDPLGTAQAICNSAIEWNEEVGVVWVDFTMHSALDRYLK